jgi:hypothetical protein
MGGLAIPVKYRPCFLLQGTWAGSMDFESHCLESHVALWHHIYTVLYPNLVPHLGTRGNPFSLSLSLSLSLSVCVCVCVCVCVLQFWSSNAEPFTC